MKHYDVLVIGAGPAGLTAAMYTARKELSTGLVSPDVGGQILLTGEIENYPGFASVMSFDLTDRMEAQVRRYPVAFETASVETLSVADGGGFSAQLDDGGAIRARAVIVTAGRRPRTLGIPGETELVGRGVSYCATCDGPLYRGKTAVVVGGGDSAVQAATELSDICTKVFLLVRNRLTAQEILQNRMRRRGNVDILTGVSPIRFSGDGRLSSVLINVSETGETKEIAADGCFIEIGGLPNTGFLPEQLLRNAAGEIVTDRTGATNVPGLFAAGDVTDNPYKQIVIAAGEGAAAALSAHEYLLRQPCV